MTPDEIDGIPVRRIDSHAFELNRYITSVAIGNHITIIGVCAFHSCRAMEKMTFGKSVNTIGDDAFHGCMSLVIGLLIGKKQRIRSVPKTIDKKRIQMEITEKRRRIMKKLTKRILVMLLCLVMTIQMCMPVFALDGETEPVYAASPTTYVSKAQNAVKITQEVMKTLGVEKWGNIGKSLADFASQISKGLNTTNTILKFLGLGGGGEVHPTLTEQIYEEIQLMHTDIKHIDENVNKISDTLSNLSAESELHYLALETNDMNANWLNFERTYMENGMQEYLGQYEYMIREALGAWCKNKNADSRTSGVLDNSKIGLIYDESDELVLNSQSKILPKDLENSKYIILEEKCLPDSIDGWQIDKHNNLFSQELRTRILDALESEDPNSLDGVITSNNYPIFTKEGWADATDEEKENALNQICSDANDELIHRISVNVLNTDKGSGFVGQTVRAFNNYCTNLAGKRGTGLDAMIQCMYLTSGFEGEVKDEYYAFCSDMLLKTDEYATFTLDIIGKCDTATKEIDNPSSEAAIVSENWLNVAIVLKAAVDNGVLGKDNYCYLTKSSLELIPLEVRLPIKVYYSKSKAEAQKLEVEPECNERFHQTEWQPCKKFEGNLEDYMIDSQKAQVLGMLYFSRGGTDSYLDYLNKWCGDNDYVNPVLDVKPTKYLAGWDSNSYPLSDADKTLVLDWARSRYEPITNPTANDLNSKYIKCQTKAYGSVIDVNTGKIKNNQTILVNIYGESEYDSGFFIYPKKQGVTEYPYTKDDEANKAYYGYAIDYFYTLVNEHEEYTPLLGSNDESQTGGEPQSEEDIAISELGENYQPLDSLWFTLARAEHRELAIEEIDKAAGEESNRSATVNELVKEAITKIESADTSALVQAYRIEYSALIREAKAKETYTVTFHSEHGTAPVAQTVLYGKKATEPTAPTENGYIFDGWYKEEACENAWNFDVDVVTGNTNLYAKWEKETYYTVSFNMSGHGTQITAQTVADSSKATKPADPTESGYTFDGWYADANCSTKFDFNSAITADTTVYAKWTKNAVTPTDPTSPQTGDNSMFYLWLMLLAGSGAVLTGITTINCRKKKQD